MTHKNTIHRHFNQNWFGLNKDGEKVALCACKECLPLARKSLVTFLSKNAVLCNCGCGARYVKGKKKIQEALKQGWNDLAEQLQELGVEVEKMIGEINDKTEPEPIVFISSFGAQ